VNYSENALFFKKLRNNHFLSNKKSVKGHDKHFTLQIDNEIEERSHPEVTDFQLSMKAPQTMPEASYHYVIKHQYRN
jgi:hypothetical protein